MSVRLRPLEPGDEAWLGEWLRAIAQETGWPAPAVPGWLAGRDRVARLVELDGERAGLVAWTIADGAVGRFQLLALEPRTRRRGRGVEAAILAEREMVAAGAQRALGPVPGTHGIAAYFWLRLGYRMLGRRLWPRCEGPAPVAWMGRDLQTGEGGSDD